MEWWKDEKAIAGFVAIGGAIGAVITTLANLWRGRKKDRAESKRALSQSEAEFREDVLRWFKEAGDELKACRNEREECRRENQACNERALALEARIDELEADLRSVRAQLAQHVLPLGSGR